MAIRLTIYLKIAKNIKFWRKIRHTWTQKIFLRMIIFTLKMLLWTITVFKYTFTFIDKVLQLDFFSIFTRGEL